MESHYIEYLSSDNGELKWEPLTIAHSESELSCLLDGKKKQKVVTRVAKTQEWGNIRSLSSLTLKVISSELESLGEVVFKYRGLHFSLRASKSTFHTYEIKCLGVDQHYWQCETFSDIKDWCKLSYEAGTED